ncbi:MAG: hypothetical protein WKF65_17120 [Gaiellaceae bacterium]
MRTISQYEFGAQCSIRVRLDWVRQVMRHANETAGRLHPIELEPDAAEWTDNGRLLFYYPDACYSVDYELTSVFEHRAGTLSLYRPDGTCAAVTRTAVPGAPLVAAGHTARPCERPERN